MDANWIVVVVQRYYPAVYHFKDEIKAREKYDDCLECGYITHLAEVKEQNFNEEEAREYGIEVNVPSDLDSDL